METAGTTNAFAVGADEAPDLARLLEGRGPYVTVQLTTDARVDNAAQRSMQHWRNVRDELEAQGADGPTLDAVEAVVPDLHLNGAGSVVVATQGRVVLTVGLDDPPPRDRGAFGPLPQLGPVIAWRQLHQPHLIVLADRSGADLIAVGPHGEGETHTAGNDNPGDPHLHKGHPGGWSQRRFQERAENLWEENARAVAERVEEIARLLNPVAILVAGDVRAVALLEEHLDDRLAPLVRELDGSRHADSGADALADAAWTLIKTVAAEDTVAFLERFREEKGQADRATDGLAATIEALNAAQVETLLVHDDPDDDRSVWFATDGPLVATDEATLAGYGVEQPAEGRLVDALVRAAFATGARVRLVPKTVVTDGVGAILRYATGA